MKKTYSAPALEVSEAQVSTMLAESLPVMNQTVDGSAALSKEDDAWDIWGE